LRRSGSQILVASPAAATAAVMAPAMRVLSVTCNTFRTLRFAVVDLGHGNLSMLSQASF
jgi:hypothetical protein